MTASRPEAIVRLTDVCKTYQLGKLQVRALDHVSVEIEAGDFCVIAGPSGSGKTTLLNLVGCVDVATSGQVIVDGLDTGKLKERELTRLRLQRLGFIFQSFNLVGVLDAFQNVEFPLLLLQGMSRAERKRRVDEMLEKVGLAEHSHHRPNELSGGQRQRVAIARALVTRPHIVLADEPTANLDSKTGKQIIDLMRDLNRVDGTTFIFSTHDHSVMSQARRVIELVDGRIASVQRLDVTDSLIADGGETTTSEPQAQV